MSTPETLKDIYADELKDLWSANDQMASVLQEIAGTASDEKLKKTLQSSVEGIKKHAASLKNLLDEADEEVKPERCAGMAGLVNEAKKHAITEAPENKELQDIVILAQYQRMCHYGIAGFGAAAAYAKALGMKEHAAALQEIVSDIYKADEYASKFSEKTSKAAKAAA